MGELYIDEVVCLGYFYEKDFYVQKKIEDKSFLEIYFKDKKVI